jgi:hypothetical protein
MHEKYGQLPHVFGSRLYHQIPCSLVLEQESDFKISWNHSDVTVTVGPLTAKTV